MKIVFLKIMFIVFGITLMSDVFAQCKDRKPFYAIETDCAKQYSESSYLSDGQNYRALLKGNEIAEFHTTFYDENTYRIAACTDVGGSLIFTIKDPKDNVLFTNKDHENAPYWDLEFNATLECKIIIQLPPETQELARGSVTAKETETNTEPDSLKKAKGTTPQVSVCSVLIIGYKQ